MGLTFATFNVNGIRARLTLLSRWLKEKRPVDVLLMQEIKCRNDAFPHRDFEAMGYTCAVNGEKGFNGVAICAKAPLTNVITHFDAPTLDRQKRLVQAQINKTTVICCYAPRGAKTGEKKAFKAAFYRELTDYITQTLPRKPALLLGGDLNVALTESDVYDPALFQGEVGFLPEERAALRSLLQTGLHDCWHRHHRPDIAPFTWWDYRTAAIWRNEGMRLDYLLASDTLCENLEEIAVDLWPRRRKTPTPSDHAPVVATFKEAA
ncbi:MAG: exodeoxyribonuclease III [Epsilonproteobacteria bacterium]|nr:exodeoxyribonuclease III [Campylobacterota bacterium]